MKAIIEGLRCYECGYVLYEEEAGESVVCLNSFCSEYKVEYLTPALELERVTKKEDTT